MTKMVPTDAPFATRPIDTFMQEAGLVLNQSSQALLCFKCVLEGSTTIPPNIVMYQNTSVCAQHLPSMVDLEA